MIALTTNITIAHNIPRAVKWEILWALDRETDVYTLADKTQVVGALEAAIRIWGPNDEPYPITHIVTVRDAGPSTVLRVKASPTNFNDQFEAAQVTLTGAYTALAAIWNGTTTPATRAGRKKALEVPFLTWGVLGPEFAGT